MSRRCCAGCTTTPPPPLEGDHPRAQILVSGVTMTAALKAQQMLADEWGVAADVWSVTSWNELRRDAVDTEQWNLTHPGEERRQPLRHPDSGRGRPGPVIAASDYMRAVQDQIAPWVRHTWCSLGTDGFGFADTRAAARRFFLVDAESIVVATLRISGTGRVSMTPALPRRPSIAIASATPALSPAWPRRALGHSFERDCQGFEAISVEAVGWPCRAFLTSSTA